MVVASKPAEPISGICCVCLTGEDKENGLTLISCSGRCCRQFHLRCIKLRQVIMTLNRISIHLVVEGC